MTRTPLPTRRAHEIIRAIHRPGTAGAMGITIGLGRYEDGRLGEVFLDPDGIEHAPLMRDVAILLSVLLQHRCDITKLRASLTREADGTTPCTLIGTVVDAVADHEETRA
jgi:hypothetical protein